MISGAGFTTGTEKSILCVIGGIYTEVTVLCFNELFVLINTRLWMLTVILTSRIYTGAFKILSILHGWAIRSPGKWNNTLLFLLFKAERFFSPEESSLKIFELSLSIVYTMVLYLTHSTQDICEYFASIWSCVVFCWWLHTPHWKAIKVRFRN